MSLRPHKHPLTVLLCLALLCGSTGVLAAVDDAALDSAKQAFDKVWSSASETSKRRDQLEQSLEQFDSRVKQARVALEKASRDRLNVRTEIAERRKLIEALTAQIEAVNASRSMYQEMADSQRDELVAFVRFMAYRRLEVHDTGPVLGGSVLRRVLHGSLGDSIEQELSRTALLQTRQTLLTQLGSLADESEKTRQRLQGIAQEIETELKTLQDSSTKLDSAVEKHAAAIDNSWKERVLTEQELSQVRAEAAEVEAKVADMQANLVKINNELKDAKLKELREALAVAEANEKEVQAKKNSLLTMDKHWQVIEDEAPKALQRAMELRNSDVKLYKFVQQVELSIKNKQQLLTDNHPDQIGEDGSAKPDGSREAVTLRKDIEFLDQQLKMMKNGIPMDPAAEYVRKKQAADRATAERKTVAAQIEAVNVQLAAATKKVSDGVAAIDDAIKNFELADLPLFSWPVRGRITAGYLNEDYVRVFGFAHRAIDIAVPQGTPVHSVADGVVYAVKFKGDTSYAYILIAHANGISSLYGHVSQVFVKAGDRVRNGQAIGMSGGARGGVGSGIHTTGSHLHLEIMEYGKHVDPLTVLPKR